MNSRSTRPSFPHDPPLPPKDPCTGFHGLLHPHCPHTHTMKGGGTLPEPWLQPRAPGGQDQGDTGVPSTGVTPTFPLPLITLHRGQEKAPLLKTEKCPPAPQPHREGGSPLATTAPGSPLAFQDPQQPPATPCLHRRESLTLPALPQARAAAPQNHPHPGAASSTPQMWQLRRSHRGRAPKCSGRGSGGHAGGPQGDP